MHTQTSSIHFLSPYSFQGQEHDDEVKGEGNSMNYKYRMHDPRVGRFFAVDPLAKKYPYYSPYAFSGNRLVDCVELEGLEPLKKENVDNGFYIPTMQINLPNGGSVLIWAHVNSLAVTNATIQTIESFPNFATVDGAGNDWQTSRPQCGGNTNYFKAGEGGLSKRIEGISLDIKKVFEIQLPDVVCQNIPIAVGRSLNMNASSPDGGPGFNRNSTSNNNFSNQAIAQLTTQLNRLSNNINNALAGGLAIPGIPALNSCTPPVNLQNPTITINVTYNPNLLSDSGIAAMNNSLQNTVNGLSASNPNINFNFNTIQDTNTTNLVSTENTNANLQLCRPTITTFTGTAPTTP